MDKSKIYMIDMVLIVSTLVVIASLIGYSSPLVIAPISNNITQSETLFSIKDTNTILIDTNINFTKPINYLPSDGLKLKLEPNTYYFKTIDETFSEIITLTVKSNIVLELKKSGNTYNIINSGKKPLKVEVHDVNSIIDEMQLNPYSKKRGDSNE